MGSVRIERAHRYWRHQDTRARYELERLFATPYPRAPRPFHRTAPALRRRGPGTHGCLCGLYGTAHKEAKVRFRLFATAGNRHLCFALQRP